MSPPGDWWRLLVMPILAALAAAIGVYAFGGPLIRSIVIGVTIGTVLWLLLRAMMVEIDPWPPKPEQGYEYGRFPQLWEISGFEAALRRPEYLGRRAIRAVREVAGPVLLRRGIVLGDVGDADRARKLLGSRSFELLTNPEHGPVSRPELLQLVDRVTELATAHGAGLRPVRIDSRLLPRRTRRSWGGLIGGLRARRSPERLPPSTASSSAAGPTPAASTPGAPTPAAPTPAAPTTTAPRTTAPRTTAPTTTAPTTAEDRS